jgi:hypothetical protein
MNDEVLDKSITSGQNKMTNINQQIGNFSVRNITFAHNKTKTGAF